MEVSPELTVPPVGKESLGWTSSSLSVVGHFLGVPAHSRPMGITGESAGPDPWEGDCEREAV